MKKYLMAIVSVIGMAAAISFQLSTRPITAQAQQAQAQPAQPEQPTAVFDADGKLKRPTGYRSWVFVGAPLTPNALQPGGKANFPEYHHVYIEKRNVEAYLKTGEFPEGTVMVKELTRVLDPTFPDGSRTEPSGRGYFNGAYNGMDVTVKDSKRFAETNNWGFFNFGHHAWPLEETAKEASISECAGCHIANVAKTDMTWIQFYPLLRDKEHVSGSQLK
jgi:Cytochrome P460